MSVLKADGERGAALIIVLGLVAVISGWAATATYEDMLSMRRAENMQVSTKAALACLSALELAKAALRDDVNHSKTDNLEEDWAQATPPFPVDDGLVSGEIIDVNRYFNLNSIVDHDGKASVEMIEVAKRLFALKNLDADLVNVLVDWLDVDDIPYGPSGMEDSSYYDKDYRVKNAHLDRWQELYFLEGFDAKVLHTLQDVAVVWALPKGGYSLININTVEPDVLQAMFPNMTSNDVQIVTDGRPYSDINALKNSTWAQGIKAQKMFSYLSVLSDGFMVRTHAFFGRADWRELYGLERTANKLILRWRERLLWQP